MEDHRHELCVIFAGYPAEMATFIDANPGLASRVSRRIDFPDYSDDELAQIFERMAAEKQLSLSSGIANDLRDYTRRVRPKIKARQWGNARSVRNILERGLENQSLRLRANRRKPSKQELLQLEPGDFAFLLEGAATVW